MVRRVSASQFNSMMRQAAAKQRQAISDYNRKVRQHNANVKQAVVKTNRAIGDYNREVRAHNARVQANRHRLKTAIANYNREAAKPRTITYRTTVTTLHESYERLNVRAEQGHYPEAFNETIDLAEREAANGVILANVLANDGGDDEGQSEPTEIEPNAELIRGLGALSLDLDKRWRGALFALSPSNPDAARHFCTSAREIFTNIFDLEAPDNEVEAVLPSFAPTKDGKPSRRAKIHYLLRRSGLADDTLESFVEADLENIVSLFRSFNDGTHGVAGRFWLRSIAGFEDTSGGRPILFAPAD